MGSSNCSNLFCKYEKNIEITTPFNQPTSNNEYQKNIRNNSNDFNNKDEYNNEKGIKLIPNIAISVNNISNNQDIKSFIKLFNIREISFPIDKNKLNDNSGLMYEKIEKQLSKFQPCDKKELNKIELYLVNILINIKNKLNGNIKEYDKPILCGKLQKILIVSPYGYITKRQTERFCVLYYNVFKYYKNEIQFLKGLKPLNILYLNQIARINIVKLDINSAKLKNIMICNKFPIEKEEKNYKNFERNEIKDIFKNHSNEPIIIFSSDDENTIYNWFAYLNFLFYSHKENL